MDEFLSIASHEVRTPLTTIKANVQLARQRAERVAATMRATGDSFAQDTEAVVRLLSRAASAIDRQNRLVGDLLDVSRIQQGRSELRREPLDLAVLTRDAVEEQRITYPSRHITLTLPQREVAVVADGDRIRQVIDNYLINALKYSDPQQPVAATLTVDDSVVRVTVSDHGPGIPLDEREHIWNRFHQVPGISHQSGSLVGLGLGLYICRDIVERHDGHVGVEDAPGGGSTFWFTLPLSR
jgi:signal transduction histidine kinase